MKKKPVRRPAKKPPRKAVRKAAKRPAKAANLLDRFELKMHTQVNGEIGTTAVVVLDREPDSQGRVGQKVYADDRLRLDADRERGSLAGRIAKTVGQGGRAAWKGLIDPKW